MADKNRQARDIPAPRVADEPPVSSRRELLAAAHKFSILTAALGVTGAGLAGNLSAAALKPIQKLFELAVDTGDMERAIERYGKEAGLDAKQLAALRSLTRAELAALKEIRDKLAPLGNGKVAMIGA